MFYVSQKMQNHAVCVSVCACWLVCVYVSFDIEKVNVPQESRTSPKCVNLFLGTLLIFAGKFIKIRLELFKFR